MLCRPRPSRSEQAEAALLCPRRQLRRFVFPRSWHPVPFPPSDPQPRRQHRFCCCPRSLLGTSASLRAVGEFQRVLGTVLKAFGSELRSQCSTAEPWGVLGTGAWVRSQRGSGGGGVTPDAG